MLSKKRVLSIELIAALFLLGGLYLAWLSSYLLFHTLSEMFRAAVAVAIFMLVWNVRRSLDNKYLTFVSVVYVFVCGLDIVHTLTYEGMGVFPGYGTNLTTQLWIGARYLESVSLLIAAIFVGRLPKLKFTLAGYVVTTSLLLGTIFYWRVFPACFIEGAGLTPFKRISEYIVSLIFAASAALLVKKRDQFDPKVLRWLAASIVLNALAELCFSFSSEAFGILYLLTHILKIIAFYFLYRAIIEIGISQPFALLFRNLKESEQLLRKERDFIAGILSTGYVMVVVTDREGRILRANKAGERLTGYSFEEMRGRPLWDFVIPGEAEELKMEFRQRVADQEPVRRENSILAKNGSLVQVLWSSNLLRDEREVTEDVVISGIDITERKQAEESLRESQSLFQKLAQVSPVGIFRTDAKGRCIYVNKRWQKIAGLSMGQALGEGWSLAIHPEDRERVAAEWYASARQNSPFRMEYRFLRPDGAITWVMGQATAETDDRGQVTGYVGTITDITDLKIAEEALHKAYNELDIRVQERTQELGKINELLRKEIQERQQVEESLSKSEVRYRTVADNTYDWEWWKDPQENFIYVSPASKKITHHEAEEFTRDPDLLLRIIHPDDRSPFIRHQNEVEQKATSGETEFRILRPDGSVRWIAHACQPVFDEHGRALGRRGSNRDITERKKAEEALRESTRQLRYLSSQILTAQETERRRVSRELHDELGGALAVLKLRTSSMAKSLEKGQEALREEHQQNLQLIDQIIDNVHRLSRDLSPSILEDIGLTAALHWLIDNFVNNYKIKVATDVAKVDHLLPRDSQIMIYRILQEALTNIGKHAQAKNVTVQVQKDDSGLHFFVEDDGRGFDASSAGARPVAVRGMGLATIDERVRMLGGSISLWSKEGKGTRIALRIPINKGEGL